MKRNYNKTFRKELFSVIFAVCFFSIVQVGLCQSDVGDYFAGQDLHLAGAEMTICISEHLAANEHLLIFDNEFSMSIGDNQFSSDSAVVWLQEISSEYRGQIRTDYSCQVYLHGNVSVIQGKAARTTDLSQNVIDRGEALVARFQVSGEVFATAAKQFRSPFREVQENQIYQSALDAVKPLVREPTIAKEAEVPTFEEYQRPMKVKPKKGWKLADVFKMKLPQFPEPTPEPKDPVPEAPKFQYPVSLSGVWGVKPEITKTTADDGSNVVTITGRFYLWQKRDEKGGMFELQADSAVIYYGGERFQVEEKSRTEGVFASGSINSIYLNGNIVITEGPRTVRAQEAYYDLQKRQALVVKAQMRHFDTKRGLPVYLYAEKLRQVSEDVFRGDDITLTTSEFYMPQVSSTASKMVLTDTTAIDARTGKEASKGSYDGVLYDMRMKYGKTTVFKWPKLRTNMERPDIPLKSLQIGSDSELGTAIETNWHLSRLLGRKEPEGVDSTLAVDYFSDRGPGVGALIDYRRQNYFGRVMGYVLKDRGNDDLGRGRENVEHSEDYRSRFRFQHRHYLPYDWQATIEVSYVSDRSFLEAFWRDEFYTGKDQETVVHLKRIKENWGFSVLGKFRINDFTEETEELPTTEFHLKGASLWDNKLTFYSDTQLSRLRDRLGDNTLRPNDPEQFYTFASTRNEIDMPFMWNTVKVVPFVAGTYGFEDQRGYFEKLDETTTSGDDSVWVAETGVRLATMFWKEDQFIKSRLWDINGIRHIIKPHAELIMYHEDEDTVEMRDVVNLGLSQRWQTRRGPKDDLRSLDWMRLDIDVTFLGDDADSAVGSPGTYGPAKFLWNDPAIPIFNRRNDIWNGMARDSVNIDYLWRLSDTSTILSDLNYDIESGVVQQFDIGVSRYVYPNLSYYVGSRYLRPLIAPYEDGFEKGSNSVVAAATYVLNPRYTLSYAQEYNFDYEKNIKGRITILRHYHRMYYGLTYSTNKALDRDAIVFSIWPEGIKELAFGERKYAEINPLVGEQY